MGMTGGLQHRRGTPRLRLGIEARFTSLEGAQPVLLQDLSKTGAKLLLADEKVSSSGFLHWLQYEMFAELAWRKGRWCGVQFDEPVPEDWVLGTRAEAPALAEERDKRLRQFAQKFVEGKPIG
jgi:hypothetical protein